MDEDTRQHFEAAVERKKRDSEERSHHQAPTGAPPQAGAAGVEGDQHSLISDGRKTQDVFSTRDKNSGKGKKTADKWNQ
jgi:hypothetical protein